MGIRKVFSRFSCFTRSSLSVTPCDSVPETPDATHDIESACSTPPSGVPSTPQPNVLEVKENVQAGSDVPSCSTEAVSSSSTPPPSVPKEPDHIKQIRGAADAVDLDDLSNYISQYLAFIKREGKKPSPVSAAKGYWPGSKSAIDLKELLSGVAETFKVSDAKTIAQEFLKGVGGLHAAATGFLVIGKIMERYENISENKEECLCLLERMKNLIQEVKQLKERPRLMEPMEAKIKVAMELIIEVSLACCTQIDKPKYKKFFSTDVNKKELQRFQTRLTELHRKIELQMDFVMHDLQIGFPVCPGHSEECEEFRRENKGQIEKVIELVKRKSEKRAVAVILYGLGGTGKTALADAVYWSLYHEKVLQYGKHEEVECKYSYVRLYDHTIPGPDIPKLQIQILQDLTLRKADIRRYEEGRVAICEALKKEVVFIYIDNVLFPDKAEQGLDAFEHLLPRTPDNVKELRLLITTRDKGAAVEACKWLEIETELYPIETLENAKARQLLEEELNRGEDLVNGQLNGRDKKLDSNQINQIVQICGGIPKLLIKVAKHIGCPRNREKAQKRYKEVISKKKNNWKGPTGWNIASYAFAHKDLDEELKDPFFDICLYFQGWHWEELSNIVGKSELDSLEDRALVTKDVNSMTAKVHNVILAIGIHNKGRRFKFTSASEFEEVLNEDLCGIKGIWSNDNIGPLNIDASKLDLMCGSLRVLALENSTKVNGQCEKIFKKLFFFSAEISYLPVALGQMPSSLISKLRVLRLRKPQQVHLRQCRSIESLPESNGQFNLSNSINLSSTDLKELPEEFCSLSSLTEIKMDNCRRLENLPDRLGDVTSLRKLSLSGCVKLKKLPETFSQLKLLEHLNLSCCVTLEELCADFKSLSSLRVLSLKDCKMLKNLPQDFHCLTLLEHLCLSDCDKLEAKPMESIVKMKTLQIVDIQRSPLLHEEWQKIKEVCNQWSDKVVRTSGQGSSNEENVERNNDMQE